MGTDWSPEAMAAENWTAPESPWRPDDEGVFYLLVELRDLGTTTDGFNRTVPPDFLADFYRSALDRAVEQGVVALAEDGRAYLTKTGRNVVADSPFAAGGADTPIMYVTRDGQWSWPGYVTGLCGHPVKYRDWHGGYRKCVSCEPRP